MCRITEGAVESGLSSLCLFPPLSDLFQKSIANEIAKKVPQPALLWGAAGIIPYVSTAGASIYLARQAQLVALGESPGSEEGERTRDQES